MSIISESRSGKINQLYSYLSSSWEEVFSAQWVRDAVRHRESLTEDWKASKRSFMLSEHQNNACMSEPSNPTMSKHTHTHTKRRAWWHRQQSNEWRTPIMHIVQIQNCAVLLSTDMRCHQGSRPHCLTSPSLKICRSTSRTSTHTLNHPCNYSLWNAGNSCVKHMSPWKVLEFNSQKVVQAWNES